MKKVMELLKKTRKKKKSKKKLNNKAWYWVLWSGVVVVGFFFLELWAIFDGVEETRTLTWNILTYINPNMFFVGLGALILWILWHFGRGYIKIEK